MSLDLLTRSLLALGASKKDIARMLARYARTGAGAAEHRSLELCRRRVKNQRFRPPRERKSP